MTKPFQGAGDDRVTPNPRKRRPAGLESCPSREQLEGFLSGKLDDSTFVAIEDHVSVCQSCLRELEHLTGVESAFGAESLGTPSFPGGDLLHHLKEATPASQWAKPGSASSSPAQEPGAHSSPSHWPVVADFQILGELGRGGMAVVYKARQISLNRLVALKMVLAGAHESVLGRFRTEAEAVARLQHANIVQIFAIGDHEGQPFIVLELVEGETLAQRLNGTPQRPTAAAALVEALARAMHVAHEQGIIHRDLKPSNILLKTKATAPEQTTPPRPVGGANPLWKAVTGGPSAGVRPTGEITRGSGLEVADYGVPKIADFGLAKLIDDTLALTHTGDLLGTPSYMAPEQALAASHESRSKNKVAVPSDVYSLGAILYEMLTGRPPFKADTPMRTLLQVLHQDAISPSLIQSSVPDDLATISLKCLEKEIPKRYDSALALAEDLRRFRHGEPILARRVGPMGVLWRRCKRRPVMAAMAFGFLASLNGGLIGMAILWLRSEANRRLADRHRRTAERSAEDAESSLYFSRIAQAQLEWRLNDAAATFQLLKQCVPGPGEPDRRGWEWYYLWNLTHSDVVTLDPGESSRTFVSGVRFSQDGQHLVVGGGAPFGRPRPSGEVSVWDLSAWEAGKQPVRVCDLHEDSNFIQVTTASNDARIVAYAGRNGLLKVWEPGAGGEPRAIAGHGALISSLSLSPDNRRLAAGDNDGVVTVSDTKTGEILLRLRGAWVRFVDEGRRLVTAEPVDKSQGAGLAIWDAADGRLLRRLSFEYTRFEVSPDGTALLLWQGAEARVLDWSTGQIGPAMIGHSGDIINAAFGPDRLHVATASADGTVRVWDARTGREELIFRGHLSRVYTVAFHPNGRYLASGDQEVGQVKIWDLTRHLEHVTVGGAPPVAGVRPPFPEPVALALGFTSDSRRLREVRKDGRLRDRAANGGPGTPPVRMVPVADAWLVPATVARFSSDGRWLAGVDKTNSSRVIIWDATTGQSRIGLQSTLPVYHIAWARDAGRLVTVGLDWKRSSRREVRVWDVTSGKLLADIRPGRIQVENYPAIYGVAALSPDGKRVAFDDYTERNSSLVRVRDVATGREPSSVSAGEPAICALEFSSGGGLLASVTVEGLLTIHDFALGRTIHTEPLHTPSARMGMLAFSPDDRLIAMVDRNQVQVWHVRTGQVVLALRGAPPRRGDNAFNPLVAWSPDGRFLAAFNHDNTITVWDGTEGQSPIVRRQAAEERAFAWHLVHARLAIWKPETRYGAEFHLRALANLEPPSDELKMDRGILYACLGRWREAADDVSAAHARQPSPWISWSHANALLQLQANDVDGWRRVCAELRDRHGQTTDHQIAENLARALQLAPGIIDDPDQMLRWCELQGGDMKSFLLGGACYRDGRFQEAVRHLELATQAGRAWPSGWAFLAMSHARLGQVDQARKWYARLEQWLTERGTAANDKSTALFTTPDDWPTWLEALILRREAQAVLQAAEVGARPAPP